MQLTSRIHKGIALVVTLGGVLIMWFILISSGVDTVFVPSPHAVWRSFLSMYAQGLGAHLGVTTLRVFIAVMISFLVAIPVALLMHQNRFLQLVLSPVIDFIRYLPVPALIPLLILFLGIGESVKITVLFLGTFFQVVILALGYLRNIHQEYYELSYLFHFSLLKKWKMQVSAILPELWDTLRISIGLCWTYVIIAELVATDRGVGRIIKEAQRFSDSSKLYVVIIVIGVVGLLIDQGMKYLAPKLFPYRYVK